MSLRHHKAIAWEQKLKQIFDQIDHDLEARYGDDYPRHPVRPAQGKTANPEHDGLFAIGASFSAGYGSTHGAGYIIKMRVATLSKVSSETIEAVEDFVVTRLREELSKAFPDRELTVSRDGNVFKIHGDLSLGTT